MSLSIVEVLDRIGKKLKLRDIRRSDLRYADLLEQLPAQFPSVLEATKGLRLYSESDLSPELRTCLSEIDSRITLLTRVKLEQELSQGAHCAFKSPQDAQILVTRMGWTYGLMHTYAEVAQAFSTSVATVKALESQAKEQIQRSGFFCPNLMLAVREVSGAAPRSDKQLSRQLQRLGISSLRWEGRAFLAAADLVGIPHDLRIIRISDVEYITRLNDESYPERVVAYAKAATAGRRRATLSEIAATVSGDIKQSVRERDVRVVVVHLPGVKFHGDHADTFSFLP